MTIWLKTIAWRHPDMPWKYETECDSESPGEWYYNRRKWELSQVTNGKDYDEMALIFAIELPNEVPYPAERDNSTLPPGLQAIRERAAMSGRLEVIQLLDLIETLAGALTEIQDEPKGTWHSTPGDPTKPSWEYYASCIEWCQDRARAALDKYRRFGQPKVERET